MLGRIESNYNNHILEPMYLQRGVEKKKIKFKLTFNGDGVSTVRDGKMAAKHSIKVRTHVTNSTHQNP